MVVWGVPDCAKEKSSPFFGEEKSPLLISVSLFLWLKGPFESPSSLNVTFLAVYGDFEAVYKVSLHAHHPVDTKSIALNVDASVKGN